MSHVLARKSEETGSVVDVLWVALERNVMELNQECSLCPSTRQRERSSQCGAICVRWLQWPSEGVRYDVVMRSRKPDGRRGRAIAAG